MSKAIRLVRPLQTEYMIVGGFLMNWQNAVYNLTEDQFVGECMRLSGGSLNPIRIKTLYQQLMEEAGLNGTEIERTYNHRIFSRTFYVER